MNHYFASFSKFSSNLVGKSWSFIFALLFTCGWLIAGHFMNYSTRWESFYYLITTVFTFLIVFLIQNTQNRDSVALDLKIDELIRSHKHANNLLINLSRLNDDQLEQLESYYKNVGKSDQKEDLKEIQKILST